MTRRLAFVMILAAAVASAADPNLLSYVMPDAKVVAGINAQTSLTSPFGQYLLAQIQGDQGFQKFMTDTGFDPRRDLREVVIASVNPQPHGSGLVVVKGVFDRTRILDQAKAHGAAIANYRGADILSGASKQGEPGGVALVDASTLVAGKLADIQAAVDRKGAKPSFDSALLSKVNSVSAANDAWFVSAGGAPNLPGAPPLPGGTSQQGLQNALQGIQQTSGGVKFGTNIMISVEAITRSAQDASALADVIRFLAGLALMNQNDPNAAQAAQMLNSMSLTTQANSVRVSLNIPENDFEQLLKPRAKPGPKKI